jgi:hypothetical protein
MTPVDKVQSPAEKALANADVLKNLFRHVGVEEFSALTMCTSALSRDHKEMRDIHQKYLSDAHFFKMNGTGKRDAAAEAQSRRALVDYGWDFKPWDDLSQSEQQAYQLGGKTPDGVILGGEPTVLDFFNVSTAIPGLDSDFRLLSSSDSTKLTRKVEGSIGKTLKTAIQKLNKYDNCKNRIVVANISDFPDTSWTGDYVRSLQNNFSQSSKSVKRKEGGQLWLVRGLCLTPVFGT